MKNVYLFLFFLFFFITSSCHSQKELVEVEKENFIEKVENNDSINKKLIKVLNQQIIEYKDSLGFVKSLLEKSKNIINLNDSSYLETTYAKSGAKIIDGRLEHWISNKDSIPVPIKIIKEKIKNDSIKNQETKTNLNKKENNISDISKTKTIIKTIKIFNLKELLIFLFIGIIIGGIITVFIFKKK